ncbi:MAG: hypothetical protein K0S58_2523 [Nitrospira sp.]|nr:hypothetical protein [Nitrospira sp.]
MVPAGVDQLDVFAAQIDGQTIGECELWNRRRGIRCAEYPRSRSVMADEQRCVGKDAASRNVVVMWWL